MNILHEKSPCCLGKIYRFGQRRRQCSLCGKTWSVWKRKRGRKRSRPDKNLFKKIFVGRQRLSQTAAVRGERISPSGASRRLDRTIEYFLQRKRSCRFTGKSYILITDALWYRFQKQRWALYLLAARTVKGKLATFLPPVLLPGKENLRDWQRVVSELPKGLKIRVVAWVSDGWRGVERVARENDWILQRCHFHLISQLQVNRGRWKKLPDQGFREQIYQLAKKLLTTKSNVKFYKERLVKLIELPECPGRLRKIIHEYIRRLEHFRSYLKYLELNLPTTTNCLESMNSLIREKCRHIKTPRALLKWSTAFLKINSTIKCNGANRTQN